MPVQRRGMRALQIWCQRVTSSYANVDVTDLTGSFRDGLAFCAIIHHFRPDLIPQFHELDKENVLENNELAYKIAEEHLDIPSLLDASDMVECDEPDKFSVVTYVSQFYHLFKDADTSRGPSTPVVATKAVGRSSESENDSLISQSSGDEEEKKPTATSPTRIKGNNNKLLFNQADLIAKYGEEIFSCSSPKATTKDEEQVSKAFKKVGVNALSNDLAAKARIFEKRS